MIVFFYVIKHFLYTYFSYTYIQGGIHVPHVIESELPIPLCTLLRTDPSVSLNSKLRYCNNILETKVSNNS